MRIGIPKEIKELEGRVGATPESVSALYEAGHALFVQEGAGERSGFADSLYEAAGATIVSNAASVYEAEMVVKVKEPQAAEFPLLRENQILFGYLHLAADRAQTEALLLSRCVAIAYDTITDPWGRLPLLIPMSELAGRLSIQVGATALESVYGGKGIFLGGLPGVRPGKVVVIGCGVAGIEAIKMAIGMGADVVAMDNDVTRLRTVQGMLGFAVRTRYAVRSAIIDEILNADLVIGAVLNPGHKAPVVISEEMVGAMQKGSVIVDLSIDQGGCCETSRPTTHSHPTFVKHGVVHYCVTNMPGACPRTATAALTNATLPYVMELANKGFKRALSENAHFRQGLNVCLGHLTYQPVAQDLGLPFHDPNRVLQ